MKPATGDEAWAEAVVGLSGVLVDGARGQIRRGTWEARRGGGGDRQRPGGIHNPGSGPGRESDRPIVAGKRVTTVEPRGLGRRALLEEEEKAAWKRFPLRKSGRPSMRCRRRTGSG